MKEKIISAVIDSLVILFILTVSVFTILAEIGRQVAESISKTRRAASGFRYRNRKMGTIPRKGQERCLH